MNVKKYHSLKESGVEWIEKIPTHWELRRIGQLFKFRNEKVSDEEYMPLSVTKDGVVPQLENVAKTIHNENRKKVLKGDIVINSRSDRRGSSGLSMLNGSCSLINHVLEPRVELEGKYIHYLFKSVPFCDEYYRWGTGIVDDLWSTQKDRMSQIQIPFPPINEQKRIARFLDDKTNAIAKLKKILEEKINKLKDYRSSLITQAVTKGLDPNVPMKDSGIEWLGEVPGHWSVQRIKNICSINGRIGFRGYSSEDIVNEKEGAITFSPSNIKDQCLSLDNLTYLSWEKYYESPEIQIKNNDIIFCKTGSSIGKVALIDGLEEAATINPQLIIFTDIKLMTKYFYYSLVSNLIQNQVRLFAGGGVMPTLTQETISNFKIFVPPLKEQAKIIEFLDKLTNDVNEVIKKAESQIMLLDTYRSSLITAAVTGQIDVSDWKEAEEELETIS